MCNWIHNASKIFIKTYLKTIRDFSQYVIFLSNGRGKFKLSNLQGDHPHPQFSCLVGYPDLSIRKTLRVVGLFTVVIFCQSKKLQHVKLKMKKRSLYMLINFNPSLYMLINFKLIKKSIHAFLASASHFSS